MKMSKLRLKMWPSSLEQPQCKERKQAVASFLLPELRRLAVPILALTIYFILYRSFGTVQNHLPGALDAQVFPRKIWQSWKVDATSFEDRDAERARTWISKNPSLRYEVLTDGNGLAYVEQVFGPSGFNRMDIVNTYKSLNARIIQADLLRYIIMYAEGGIWADIDVEAIRSFDHFIPQQYVGRESELDMIVGVETDEPDFAGHPVLGSKSQSFCQWTFVCKPRLPVMLHLIDNILIWLNKIAEEEGKPISEIELDFDEVLTGTGPSAFTNAILAEMSKIRRKSVTWKEFHGMEESIIVSRVLVLPSEAFAAGTGHSNSGNHGGKGALVKHHFHASSWTKSHPRFKHPIYGEIEKCNWDPECVKLWDANTKFFQALPQPEQNKLLALKAFDEDEVLKADIVAQPPAILPGLTLHMGDMSSQQKPEEMPPAPLAQEEKIG